jgi:putative ABC transport system permease protein
VLQKGVVNLHMTRSQLSEDSLVAVRRTPGIASLTPLVYRPELFGEPGAERLAYLVGVPADAQGVGAWDLAAGEAAPQPGRVVVPDAMARRAGLRVGDGIKIGDRRYVIGGTSRGTFSMANPVIFMAETDARALFDLDDGASIVAVRAAPGIAPAALAAAIEAEAEDVVALPRAQLIANDYRTAQQMGGALVRIMGLIGTLVAALIVTFTAYAFIAGRRAEFAVARALGASRSGLLTSALLQTGVVALAGGVLGAVGATALDAGLAQWAPDVAVHFTSASALQAAVLALLAAELAGFAPAWQVLRVDPALVFQG